MLAGVTGGGSLESLSQWKGNVSSFDECVFICGTGTLALPVDSSTHTPSNACVRDGHTWRAAASAMGREGGEKGVGYSGVLVIKTKDTSR